MLLVEYPRCGTCRKAKKWLDSKSIEYDTQNIVDDNPSYEQLKEWYERSNLPLKRFFNVTGKLYRENKLKDKLPLMGEDEQLKLLSSDGMLVKRPILVQDDFILVGFKEKEWEEKLL